MLKRRALQKHRRGPHSLASKSKQLAISSPSCKLTAAQCQSRGGGAARRTSFQPLSSLMSRSRDSRSSASRAV